MSSSYNVGDIDYQDYQQVGYVIKINGRFDICMTPLGLYEDRSACNVINYDSVLTLTTR